MKKLEQEDFFLHVEKLQFINFFFCFLFFIFPSWPLDLTSKDASCAFYNLVPVADVSIHYTLVASEPLNFIILVDSRIDHNPMVLLFFCRVLFFTLATSNKKHSKQIYVINFNVSYLFLIFFRFSFPVTCFFLLFFQSIRSPIGKTLSMFHVSTVFFLLSCLRPLFMYMFIDI